jgi:hypothetical protein
MAFDRFWHLDRIVDFLRTQRGEDVCFSGVAASPEIATAV